MHYKHTLQDRVKLILELIVKPFPNINSKDNYHTQVPTSKVFGDCVNLNSHRY